MDTEYNGHFIVRPEIVAEGGEKGPWIQKPGK